MDSSIATDPRFKLMGRALGVDWKEVIGACYLLWLACYERRSKRFSRIEADISAELDGFANALLHVGLATPGDTPDTIVIHGVEARIKFLQKQAERGSEGGKRSGNSRASRSKRSLRQREANASGDPEANGEADGSGTAQANTPSLTPDLDPDPGEREALADALRGHLVSQKPDHALADEKAWVKKRPSWAREMGPIVNRRGVSASLQLLQWVFGDQGGRTEYRFRVDSPRALAEKFDRIETAMRGPRNGQRSQPKFEEWK